MYYRDPFETFSALTLPVGTPDIAQLAASGVRPEIAALAASGMRPEIAALAASGMRPEIAALAASVATLYIGAPVGMPHLTWSATPVGVPDIGPLSPPMMQTEYPAPELRLPEPLPMPGREDFIRDLARQMVALLLAETEDEPQGPEENPYGGDEVERRPRF